MEKKIEIFQKIANTIRKLSMEAIQKANSGHPGLPLGCAEIGSYLYGFCMDYFPKDPKWINRDRFVLSAGHGSMLLYSCLHLAGFDLSMEDIKNFRQLNSKTPGHPEYNIVEGVEATTGPLGQGVANAVGMALALKILQKKFNTEEFKLIDNKVFCLAGDGCMMEGVSSEASSLAGHLALDNLVIIYDSNKICLDGPISETFSEDVKERYKSYGFDVFETDGHDFHSIDSVISKIKKEQKKPCFIVLNTIIGKGSLHKEGTHKVHGSPLGEMEVRETKKALHLVEEEFVVEDEVREFFEMRLKEQEKNINKWKEGFIKWEKNNPNLFKEFLEMKEKNSFEDVEEKLKKIEMKNPISGREASSIVLNFLADNFSFIYAGSADLSSSDKTFLKKYKIISKENFLGRNIKYGVREFAMAAISNGLSLSSMVLPICGTFLVFSDYMRAAIRVASLSKLQVIYQLTHDSIFLGEDGPTHQPIEQLSSLRAIPNLHVIRPADSYEVKMAWISALNYKGPTAIILSRQNLFEIEEIKGISYEEGVSKGAYIVKKEKKEPEFILFASGSELKLALEVAESLENLKKDVRVVSFCSFELFENQDEKYKKMVLGDNFSAKRVSIEASLSFGWHKYIEKEGIAISIERFGVSAPSSDIKKEFGFTKKSILQKILF